MYLWALSLLVLVACILFLDWLISRRTRGLLAHLPGYPRLPFLGSILYLMGDSQYLYRWLVEASQLGEQTRQPVVLWVGPRPVIVFSEPKDVKAVTNAFVEKPYYYQFGRVWLGDGMLTAPGSIWKRSYKKIARKFSSNIVDGFLDVFNAQGLQLVAKFKGEVGGEPFDVLHKYLAYTTLETICQTALGISDLSNDIITLEYYRAFSRTVELLMRRGLNILYHPEIIYSCTSSYREMNRCVKILHKVSNTVIEKRKKERKEMKNNSIKTKLTENGNTIKTFLDVLLNIQELDETWSDSQIKAEVDTIILGGQETVAITLCYALLMIGHKTNVQKKLHDEMLTIFGESDRSVTKEDLSRMAYCEAVLTETLRLFPPGPVILRYADHDLKLDSCTIPAGATVAVNALAAGRLHHVWGEDALQFRPERWLQENSIPPAAFLAFSFGKRACIGKRYAMVFLKTILAHCVRQLEFSSQAENMKLRIEVMLKPASGHLIQVQKR